MPCSARRALSKSLLGAQICGKGQTLHQGVRLLTENASEEKVAELEYDRVIICKVFMQPLAFSDSFENVVLIHTWTHWHLNSFARLLKSSPSH